MVRSNDIHFYHGSSTYDDEYCDECNNLETSDQFGKDINIQVVGHNNSFSYYDYDNNNRNLISNSTCLMSDLLDHLNCINPIQDPYSNKQWNQLNHHDYSEQDLYGPLEHAYNRKQELQQLECRDLLFSNQGLLKRNFRTPDPKDKLRTMLLCSNPVLLKRTH